MFVRGASTRFHNYYWPSSNFPALLLFGLLLLLGLTAFGSGLRKLNERAQLAAYGSSNVGLVESMRSSGRYRRRILVVYRDATGREWRKHFTVQATTIEVGQQVNLRYVPAAPMISVLTPDVNGILLHVVSDSKFQEQTLTLVGGLLTVFAGVMLWGSRRQIERLK